MEPKILPFDIFAIIKIQKWYRGTIFRLKNKRKTI